MHIEPGQWAALTDLYLAANSGRCFPGMTHNLNNSSHVMDLQLELLQTKMGSSGTAPPPDLGKRIQQISSASKDLLRILENIGHRFLFTQKEKVQIEPQFFLQWLVAFWNHDLFFKHRVELELNMAPDCPTLDLPPFLLTLCLEEPLKNAIESCRKADPDSTSLFTLKCAEHGEGIRFQLLSPSRLTITEDPFLPGSSTKEGHLGLGLALVRHFSTLSGWNAELTQLEEGVLYSLEIPTVKGLDRTT
jgi:signal transduction histidine kinase